MFPRNYKKNSNQLNSSNQQMIQTAMSNKQKAKLTKQGVGEPKAFPAQSGQPGQAQFQQYKPFNIQKQHANYQQQQSNTFASQATQTQAPLASCSPSIPQNSLDQKSIIKTKMATAQGQVKGGKKQLNKAKDQRGKENNGCVKEKVQATNTGRPLKECTKNVDSEQSGPSVEDQESSSLMNLSNTPINVGTNDQEVQIIKKYSSSSRYSSHRCRSAVRSSSSFDSTRVMIHALYGKSSHHKNYGRQRSTRRRNGDQQSSAKSSAFHSHEKISSITFDSFSQFHGHSGQLISFYDNGNNYYQYESMGDCDGPDAFGTNNWNNGHEIFENYSDSLEILDSQQIDRFTNKTSTLSQKSNNRRHSAADLPKGGHAQAEDDFSAMQKQHGYINEQQLINEANRVMLDYNYDQVADQLLHQKVMQASATLSAQGAFSSASNTQLAQMYLNNARKQIYNYSQDVLYLDSLLKAFCQDKRKIRELMTHCLYCIYRQQDMSKYFDEMLTITKLMRDYYSDSQKLGSVHQMAEGIGSQTNKQSKQFAVGLSMTAQLQSQLQQQVQPSFLREMITDIIGDIMKSICEQILAKMKYLGIIVKEPLFRRASVDDYSLCFDYFSRKNANSQNLIQGSSFGLSLGNYGVFTNNVDLRNLNQQGNNYDQDDSSLSGFSQCQSQRSQHSASRQEEQTIQDALRKKKELFGGIYSGSSATYTTGGLNTQLHLAFKQQQEMYLDHPKGYEFIRQEGKRSTWRDIKTSRTRLQHFIYRQQEYKQTFDMIMRSYYQLKNSLEYLEEFWLFLHETIYDKYQHGKLQFDKIWKNLFLEKILDNHYIKNFLNDVSDQYDSLQNYNQQMQQQVNLNHGRGGNADNHRYILDEIYENLIKLENDLNEDYIMDDLSKLINVDDFPLQDDALNNVLGSQGYPANTSTSKQSTQLPEDFYGNPDRNSAMMQQLNLVIANQYELIREKFRLKYNGQTLSQIVHQCNKQGLSAAQTLQQVQESKVKRATCNSARDSMGSYNTGVVANGSQSQRCQQNSTASALTGTNAPPMTKSQKKRKRKKMQEQMRRWKEEGGQQQDDDDEENKMDDTENQKKVPKIELIQCDQDVDKQEQTPTITTDQKPPEKKMVDTSTLFRKLMLKSAELKKKQKENGRNNKDKLAPKEEPQKPNTDRSQLEEDSRKPIATQESEQDVNQAIDDGKLSKRQKLNQKKKRQRIEKKKRIQQQKEDAEYDDTLMVQNDQQLLEMYKFDPNEFLDDQQLKLLIDKYDPAMNQQDVDYLMQHEDREAVINTLYTKLMEREQMNMQILRESGTLMDQYQELIDDGDIYYEDDIDGNYTSSYGTNINSKQSMVEGQQQQVNNYYGGQGGRYYYNTHDKFVNYDRNKHNLAQCNNLQVQNWQQKISSNIEILDQVEYETLPEPEPIAAAEKVSQQHHRSHSDISHEEECIYDSDFESELQLFQKKLQPKSREGSLERIYLYHLGRNSGSRGRQPRKLVPNISQEWIDELKKEIQLYNHKVNRSLDQKMKQLKFDQEKACRQGEKQSNSDRLRSPNDKTTYEVDDVKLNDAKQRLSLPNMAQRYTENCFDSQGGVKKASDQNDSFKRVGNLQGLDVYPQKSGGVSYNPFHGCTTNCTEGLSFNSPRANDQVYCYDEVDQQITSNRILMEDHSSAGLFTPAVDDQDQFKVCNDQIQSEKPSSTKQAKGNTEKKKAGKKQKSKVAEGGKRKKKGSGGRLVEQKRSQDLQPLSA